MSSKTSWLLLILSFVCDAIDALAEIGKNRVTSLQSKNRCSAQDLFPCLQQEMVDDAEYSKVHKNCARASEYTTCSPVSSRLREHMCTLRSICNLSCWILNTRLPGCSRNMKSYSLPFVPVLDRLLGSTVATEAVTRSTQQNTAQPSSAR